MELLDSRQLRAFQELARQGSFTHAARSLSLTQSAVSHSIKSLEGFLETELFERLGKTVRLTQAGEAFLPHVDRIMNRMARAQDELKSLGQPGRGRLRIGATVSISQYILPSVLRELRESFPAFEISVTTDDTRGLVDLIEQGNLDVAVGMETSFSEKLVRSHLFEDDIQMAVSPLHPFAQKQRITEQDLLDENFIFYNKSSLTYRLLEQCSVQNGVRLRASMQVGSMAAIKEMTKIGMGIGLLSPWVAERELEEGSLVFRKLPWTQLTRRWSVHSDPRHNSHMIEDVFTGICKNVVDSLLQRTTALIGR